jgi:hypothetical protein
MTGTALHAAIIDVYMYYCRITSEIIFRSLPLREEASMIEQLNGHVYQGPPKGTRRCMNKCGCWKDSNTFGGPDDVDPKGSCPKAPKKESSHPEHVDADATCHY